MQVATKFVQSIYSNTFISNSNFLIPAFPILYVFHPHRTIRPSRDFRQKLRGKTSVSPFPRISLSLSLSTGAVGVQVSCRRSVSWRWRELRKNAINEGRGSEGISRGICSGKGRSRGLRRIENREIRKRSRNLRLRQWRQLHWSSRR